MNWLLTIFAVMVATFGLSGCLATSGGSGGVGSAWGSSKDSNLVDGLAVAPVTLAQLTFVDNLGPGDAAAMKLAYETRFDAIVELFKTVPHPSKEERDRMIRRAGELRPANRMDGYYQNFMIPMVGVGLANQIWWRGGWAGSRFDEFVLQAGAAERRQSIRSTPMRSWVRETAHARAAWTILYLALQAAHGNPKAMPDTLGEFWDSTTSDGVYTSGDVGTKFVRGSKVLDRVSCGLAAETAAMTANFRAGNFNTKNAPKILENGWHGHEVWSRGRCEAIGKVWPHYVTMQAERFGMAKGVK
jgi:hypothetical protein